MEKNFMDGKVKREDLEEVKEYYDTHGTKCYLHKKESRYYYQDKGRDYYFTYDENHNILFYYEEK